MYFFAVLIGIVLGSFGNVLISRVPAGKSIVGRSHCDHCHRVLSPFELIPIVSYLALRGRCRTCKSPIPWAVPLVEATCGLIGFLCAFKMMGEPLSTFSLLVGLWALFIIAIIDFKTSTIPDALTATVLVASAVFNFTVYGGVPLVAPLVGAIFFGSQWLASRGRWVGSGDVLLAGAIGVLVGSANAMVWTLFLSYIVGAIIAGSLLFTGRLKRGAMVPFGPFLVIAAMIVVFAEQMLPRWPI